MSVCARCGAQNQPSNKFCLSCGAAMQPPPGAPHAHQGPAPGAPAAPAGYAPPPPAQAWGPPPYGGMPHGAPPPGMPGAPPPAYGAPPPQHAAPPAAPQPPPPAQAWGPPPAQPHAPAQQPALGGFSPAEPSGFRVGSPEGLNPYGATMTPFGGGAPQAPPQAPGGFAPPPPIAPPGYAQPGGPGAPPAAPPPGLGLHVPAPAVRSNDPSAFAATAPPPTADEFDAQQRVSSPAPSPVAPVAPAAAARPSRPPATSAGAARDPEHVEPNAARVLAGFLVSFEATEVGAFWPIYQGQNHIGRKGAAPGLDIEIDHPTTSSRHAILLASARPGRVKIEDLGSTNGTFVAEQALERGRKQELRDGDSVRFGGFTAIIKIV